MKVLAALVVSHFLFIVIFAQQDIVRDGRQPIKHSYNEESNTDHYEFIGGRKLDIPVGTRPLDRIHVSFSRDSTLIIVRGKEQSREELQVLDNKEALLLIQQYGAKFVSFQMYTILDCFGQIIFEEIRPANSNLQLFTFQNGHFIVSNHIQRDLYGYMNRGQLRLFDDSGVLLYENAWAYGGLVLSGNLSEVGMTKFAALGTRCDCSRDIAITLGKGPDRQEFIDRNCDRLLQVFNSCGPVIEKSFEMFPFSLFKLRFVNDTQTLILTEEKLFQNKENIIKQHEYSVSQIEIDCQ